MMRSGWIIGFFAGLAWSVPAAAQDEEPAADNADGGDTGSEPAADASAEPAEPAEGDAEAKASAQADEKAVADALEGVVEDPTKTYLFIGARYRNVMIPKFMQNLFADGGESLYAHTPGLEFAIRKAGFEYQLFAMLGLYSLSGVPFKGTSDAVEAWELIDADYQILYLGSDFMWSTDEFSPGFSMTYGAGVGLGLVFGDLGREQAYPLTPADVDDPASWQRCGQPGGPVNALGMPTQTFYCDYDPDNNHYAGYKEPTWADGGSSPIVFPWIAGQVGLRYKAHKNFVVHAELGLMLTGAFVGLGADYGL
jgi:hypothetical protein